MDLLQDRLGHLDHILHPGIFIPGAVTNKPLDLGPCLLHGAKIPIRDIWRLWRFGSGEHYQVGCLGIPWVAIPVGPQSTVKLHRINRIPW